MTKKLNSFTASQASTSTLPRLSFKRNQPKPEISRNLVTGFSRDRYIAPMWASGHITAAAGRSRSSSCGRSTRSRHLARGLCAVLFSAGIGCLGLVNLQRQGPWSSPSASALPSQCYCGPERNNWSRRLRRRKRPSDWGASLNHQGRTRRWSN
jgi:hypothetical protein